MISKNKMDILIVDDRPENLLVLESILEDLELNIIKATSGNEALGLMLEYDFALVLLDVQMPEMNGFEVAELMRGSEKTSQVPIIFVTAISKNQECMFKGYEVGAVDYLFKPIEPIILKSKVKVFIELQKQKQQLKRQAAILQEKVNELLRLQEANWKLERLSTIDELTGISNRRRFDEVIEMEWKRAIRENAWISLIMIDIDHFKEFNDNYGHLAGDTCLSKVAKTIDYAVHRPIDFVARYGGEEFAVVLPSTNVEDAVLVAERIRKEVEYLAAEHEYSSTAPYITISLGVAAIAPKEQNSIKEFINSADKYLFQAKYKGRNRVAAHLL